MGKNHRHKKNLKLEKGKTKLKSQKTQFLPKGKNVTDLSFKIKPIVLSQQLKVNEGEALSSRKLNLKDILNRLTHHNTTVKYDNCQQLLEIIKAEPAEFLKQNLARILKTLCPLVLDIEYKVRREAIKVLCNVLRLTTSSDMTSFFDILSSFLRCSMTHINLNIQEDSLILLDGLLEHVPDLVAENSDKILTNFFMLISKLKTGSKHARTIAENLQSKYTGVKWRIKVLIRLKKIFDAIYHRRNTMENRSEGIKERIIDVSQTNYAPIYGNKFDDTDRGNNRKSIELEHMENYIDTLLPLMEEAWLEMAPSNISAVIPGRVNSTTIKVQVASMLNCILGIYYLLYRLTESFDQENETKLCLKFKEDRHHNLLNVILTSFPYAVLFDKKYDGLSANDGRCIEDNLLICHLFCAQYKNIRKKLMGHARKVLAYLNDCLETFTRNKLYLQNGKLKDIFVSTIRTVLGTNLVCWRNAKLEIDFLIDNTIEHYLKNVAYDSEIDLLLLLYDLADSNQGKQVILAEKSCNHLLAPEVSLKVLNYLSLMVRKGVKPFQDCLRSKLRGILDNINDIEVNGVDMERMKIIKILCLFYYVPLKEDDRVILKEFGMENPPFSNLIRSILD